MKKLILPFALLLSSFANAQLHQSVLAHTNDLPALPLSSTDAAAKCKNATTGACNTDAVMKSFSDKHIALQTQLNNMSLAASTANTSMPDTAMLRNVQNMNPDQQRAWAMQYAAQQQAAATQNVVVPSAAEMKFNSDYANMNMTLQPFNDSLQTGWPKILKDLDDGLAALLKKHDADLAACPQLQGGEGDGGPEPGCAKNVEVNYQNAVRALYTKWLQEASAFLARRKKDLNTRYTVLESDLVACNYMDNPSQKQFKTDAISVQLGILSYQLSLGMIVSDTWNAGCKVEDIVNASKARY